MKRHSFRWTRLILLVAILLSVLGMPAPLAGPRAGAAPVRAFGAPTLAQHPAGVRALPAGLRAAMRHAGLLPAAGGWTQQAKFTAPDEGGEFGSSVALAADGSAALIGADGNNNATGAAYVFARGGSGWTQQAELIAGDGAPDDEFGCSVALAADGSAALIGACTKNKATGAAYVFVRGGSGWTQQAELTAGDGTPYDWFGLSVALAADGSTALIGAEDKNNDTGAAYVFARGGSGWTQQAKLTASDGAAGDQFGSAAALSGDGSAALIGAYYKNNGTGAAYVFARGGSGWTQQAKFTAPDEGGGFGSSVALAADGSAALIGADWKNDGTGAAYVFSGPASTSLPTLSVQPAGVPANGTSIATITLSNAPVDHQVRVLSSRASIDTLSPASGTVTASGVFTATIRSKTPGTAVIIAQDLTIGQTFSTSAQVTFTGGSPPPITGGPIAITGVSAKYPLDGRYLAGVPVPNPITVAVDWEGATPGTVDFVLNGLHHAVAATATGASYTIDMGYDLQPGANSLHIVAYNAAGQPSDPEDAAPYSIPLPTWLSGLAALGALAPLALGVSASSDRSFTASFTVPVDPIDFSAPGMGQQDQDTGSAFSIGGSLKVPLNCTSSAGMNFTGGVKASQQVLGVDLEGSLSGTGGVEIDPDPTTCLLTTAHGTVEIDIEVSGKKEWPTLTFIANFINPTAATAMQSILPQWILSVLGDVYVEGKLSGSYSSDVQPATQAPWLSFSNTELSGGPGVQAGIEFKQVGAELDAYIGTAGSLSFSEPGSLLNLNRLHFDSVTITGEAGYDLKVPLLQIDQEGKFTVTWQYPPSSGAAAHLQSIGQPTWHVIPHITAPDHDRFQGSAATPQAFAAHIPGYGALSPVAQRTISSVLDSNVYAYAEPSLAVNPSSGHALLVWVYDDPNKPVMQSLEIEYSLWNGSSWSAPAAITNDTQLDSTPQVAWTSNGTAVAVWQRIPTTLPTSTTWNPAIANQIEIASSTFNAGSNTWSPVALLTNNNVLDNSPSLARNSSGQTLVVWHENAAGQLSGSVTDLDQIMASFNNSGSWTTPAVAVGNIPGVVDFAAGYGNGAATIAYTQVFTPTGSITPTTQLYTSAWNGTSWSAPIQRRPSPSAAMRPRWSTTPPTSRWSW